ncbi:hypothetical protein E2P81_ATG05664 [Venturia nashicola]|uniref:Dienelactone hydrolase domain-containing protein n=1 Tax=Venturia nashicola TaxID=86259 RepID=A0A4Z1PC53_9PEZI|nr:hypothetical protein E6O75_ATG05804 [Venturia nashicola]TLD29370.1 hypothetical protein E2P81_ATG05664 [Venturia nashicola]
MSDLTPSPACCRIAPPPAPIYKQKGSFVEENAMKTYQTGSDFPTQAILYIYDIFGLYPQTLRGADILAQSVAGKTGSATKVFMPDWFSQPADISMYPPDTPEKMEYINSFLSANAAPNAIIPQMNGIMKSIEAKNPSIKSWGIVGFCWGGKMAALVSGPDTIFKAAAQCHPSLLDPKDAENVSVPMMVLPSGDEDVPTVVEFEKRLQAASYVETFEDMEHGWMTSKADFDNARVVAEYLRGYELLSGFFAKHL